MRHFKMSTLFEHVRVLFLVIGRKSTVSCRRVDATQDKTGAQIITVLRIRSSLSADAGPPQSGTVPSFPKTIDVVFTLHDQSMEVRVNEKGY